MNTCGTSDSHNDAGCYARYDRIQSSHNGILDEILPCGSRRKLTKCNHCIEYVLNKDILKGENIIYVIKRGTGPFNRCCVTDAFNPNILSLDIEDSIVHDINRIETDYVQLNQLSLKNTHLEVFDFSKLLNLRKIVIVDNPIKTMDLSVNINLNSITITNCREFKSILLPPNVNCLNISNTIIKYIDFSYLSDLVYVTLTNNEIEHIDMPKISKIFDLNISNNNISSIDLSNAVNLFMLNISDTSISMLDVHNCTKLEKLIASNTKISNHNIILPNSIKFLDVSDTELTTLPTNITRLRTLRISGTKIPVSELIYFINTLICLTLDRYSCDLISAANFNPYFKLIYLSMSNNLCITELPQDLPPHIKYLRITDTSITNVDNIKKYTGSLTHMDIRNCKISDVPIKLESLLS
jgi:hypothetical protein